MKNVCFSYTEEVFQWERELNMAKQRLETLESASHDCNCPGRCDYLDLLSEARIDVEYVSMRLDYLVMLEQQDLERINAEFEEEVRRDMEREEARRRAEETEQERLEREEQEAKERAEAEEWEKARHEHEAEQLRLEEEELEEEARLAREAALEQEAAEERERLERETPSTSTANDSYVEDSDAETDLISRLNSSSLSNDTD